MTKSSSNDPFKKREIRRVLSMKELQWTGDLSDDCSAQWAGLTLHCKEMDQQSWSWRVTDTLLGTHPEVDSWNNYEETIRSGEEARNRAEAAARMYISSLI